MDRRTMFYRLQGDGGPRCYLKPEKEKEKRTNSVLSK